MNVLPSPSRQDMEEIHLHGLDLWPQLQNKRLFLAGGTGFFGRWLLETFDCLNKVYGLNIELVVLSRNPTVFLEKAPHFANNKWIHFTVGDVCSFSFPPEHFDFVIHAATETNASLYAQQPLLMADVLVGGTRRMLDFAVQTQASRFLLTSSGAVYGRQPAALSHIPEDYSGGSNPCDVRGVYGEGKRMAEMLCALYQRQHGIKCLIARCFAFVGPYLPLDTHFAAGNFLNNALRREKILIQGDGTPLRSYMYGTDLVLWLLTILLKGKPLHPYHVGSEEAVSISALAAMIARLQSPTVTVQTLGVPEPNIQPERYVPGNQRARSELGLEVTVNLEIALKRSWDFYHSLLTITNHG